MAQTGQATRTGRTGHVGRAGKPVHAGQPDLPGKPAGLTHAAPPGPPVMLAPPGRSAPEDGSGQHVWLGQQGKLEPQPAPVLADGGGQLAIPGKIAGPIRNPGAGMGTRNPPGPSWATTPAGTRHVRRTAGHTASPGRRSGRMLWLAAGTAAAVVTVIAGNLTGFLPGGGQPGPAGTSKPAGPSPAALAATARSQAAQWAGDQLSSGTIISCDPAMCAALRAHHYPTAQLILLGPSAPDPLGSDVVMATAAVRSQFGRRLTTVYAPDVEAVVGTGKARIQIRAIAPDGAAAYTSELHADLQQRRAFGATLLHNKAVSAPASARRQLAAGMVDARLLNTLAILADTHPLRIVGFVGAGPGASPGIPLRSVDISGARRAGGPTLSPAANNRFLRSSLVFLQDQRPPYLALRMRMTRRSGQPEMVQLEFGAPSPLGLLATGTGEPDSQP